MKSFNAPNASWIFFNWPRQALGDQLAPLPDRDCGRSLRRHTLDLLLDLDAELVPLDGRQALGEAPPPLASFPDTTMVHCLAGELFLIIGVVGGPDRHSAGASPAIRGTSISRLAVARGVFQRIARTQKAACRCRAKNLLLDRANVSLRFARVSQRGIILCLTNTSISRAGASSPLSHFTFGLDLPGAGRRQE